MFQTHARVVQKLLYWIFLTHTFITEGSGFLMAIWTFPKEIGKFFSNQGSGALKTKAIWHDVFRTKWNRSALKFQRDLKEFRGQHCDSIAALLSKTLRFWATVNWNFQQVVQSWGDDCCELAIRDFSDQTCDVGESGWPGWVSHGFEVYFFFFFKDAGSSRRDNLLLKKCKLLC